MASFDYRNNRQLIWTANEYDPGEVSQYLPYMYVRSYQCEFSALLEKIAGWMSVDAIDKITGENPYANLYQGVFKHDYFLPYFTSENRTVSQAWQENPGSFPMPKGLSDAVKLIENTAKAILPTGGILSPKAYTGSGPQSFSSVFHLINTKAAGDYVANRTFLETIIEENLHENGAMAGFVIIPPVICEVLIPGIRYCPVCNITSLRVSNKGTLNMINGAIVPDAWEVELNFQEMVFEDRKSYRASKIAGSPDNPMSNITTRAIKDTAVPSPLPTQQTNVNLGADQLNGTAVGDLGPMPRGVQTL